MKQVCLVALLLLSFACSKNDAVTDTSATATGGATDSRAVAGETTSDPSTASDINVTVEFRGMNTHVLGKYQRTVIVKAPKHPHEIEVPDTAGVSTIVINDLGGECPSTCVFDIAYMSLQLLDGSKAPLTGDLTKTDGTFDQFVTNLKDVDPVAFDESKLADDVTGAIQASSTVSWGYFDLLGGDASATALDCQGAIGNSSTFIKFPEYVTVKYTLSGGGFLRVSTTTATHDIPLTGPNVLIKINNDVDSGMSHFHEYAKVSKDNPTMPVVVPEKTTECDNRIKGFGGVPGCVDTKWEG